MTDYNELAKNRAVAPADSRLSTQLKMRDTSDVVWRALKDSVFPSAKDQSVLMVLDYCRARGLDPLKKPCHIVPMNIKDPKTGKWGWRDVVMPGVYEHRMTAQETGEYLGHSKPEYGDVITHLGVKAPEFCDYVVYRWNRLAGCKAEFPVRIWFVEVVGTTKDKDTGKERVNSMWTKRPIGQLTKCAEAAALREAFPGELGGQMTAEEMDSQGIIDVTPQPVEPDPPESEPEAEPEPVPAAEKPKPANGKAKPKAAEKAPEKAKETAKEAKPEPPAETKEPEDSAPALTFSQAFSEIAKAQSVDALDVVRSHIDHSTQIPDEKAENLYAMIRTKIMSLEDTEEPVME